MIKRIFLRMVIMGVVVFGIVILLGGTLALFLASQAPVSSPMVNIHTPGQGDQVGLGELVPVHSTSGDRDNKIVKVELWVAEGEELRLIEVDEPMEPEHAFSIPQGWQPFNPGAHRVIVRAFNEQGDIGQATVDVEVIELPEEAITETALADGEALPAPGGLEQEGSILPDPGTQGSQGFNPPQPDPDPPQNNPGNQLGGLLLESAVELFTPQVFLTQIEVEALDFEVIENYDHVWCYASLASSPYDRVPESGYFNTTSQYHWNIEDYLGGNNRVEISIIGYQPLDMDLLCNGYRNNQLHHIGRLTVSHPPEDWTGQLIHGTGQGGEGFTISYRINPAGTDLEAPFIFTDNMLFQQKYFLWGWNGDPADIDGFRIYRDDVLVASPQKDLRSYAIPPWWTEPPCDEEYEYHVVAYRGTMESPPSNFQRYQGAVCGLENAIIHVNSQPACAGAGQTFEVKYLYESSNGPAGVGIRIFKDGQRVPGILSTYTSIQHGQGIAQLAVTYHGTETFTTNQVSVFLFDENGQDFYVQNFDRTLDWTPGSPDLIIKSATIDRNNNQLRVWVKNIGCAPTQASDLLIERHQDGWKGFLPVGVLQAKQEMVYGLDFPPEDAGRWSGEVDLSADIFDTNGESNENNNDYHLGSARIKHIHFYQMDIHDNCEWWGGKGEFKFHFTVSDGNGLHTITVNRDYHWGEGMHEMNAFLSPILSDNDDLFISVGGHEEDKPSLNPNYYLCGAGETHSHDIAVEGNWKVGGEFSATGCNNEFTVYYRIILE